MANCKIHLKSSAALELEALPAPERASVVEWLGALSNDPCPAESEPIAEGGFYRATLAGRAILYMFDDTRGTVVISLIR